MKKSELIFGELANNLRFKKDLLLFANLPKEKINSILDVYLKSEYRYYYHNYDKKFIKITGLSDEDSHSLWHIIDTFAYRIVPLYETNDIILSLKELIQDADKLKDFINKLKDSATQETLKNLDLIDDEIGNTNPRITKLEYTLQNRIVLKDEKIIKNLPIALLRVATSFGESENEVTIELLEEDLNIFLEGLNEIKKKFEIIKRSTK